MAKRGRKPKEKKGYFYETEEDAIVKYIHETDTFEKNKKTTFTPSNSFTVLPSPSRM